MKMAVAWVERMVPYFQLVRMKALGLCSAATLAEIGDRMLDSIGGHLVW